ncbi:MAG: hypothetical protein ABI477_14040 [Chryseolinea sp.]
MIDQRRAIILSGIILLTFSIASAQSYVESALVFARTRVGGSARIQAMGGSQVALGGDYSSAFSNPAGLGMFNKSEFTITPAFSTYSTSASYFGNADDATKSKINIPGLSAVFHMPLDKSGFVSGSFAISMNRNNDFNRSTVYHGTNQQTSIIDSFIDDAFGSTTSQFDPGQFNYNTPTGLAYNNYLIGPLSITDSSKPDDEYFTDVKGIPNQQEDIQTTGSSNQWNFAYGINYKDLLFFGAGIGVTSLKFKSQKLYSESFDKDDVFSDLQLGESLSIKGNGINATLGAIVRPISFLQVGLSFTTPTYYQFTETYNADLSTNWKSFDYFGDGSKILNNIKTNTDLVTSDYSLTTPMKLSTGVAFLSKYGIITGDIEYMNPAKAKYSSNTQGVSFKEDNDGIKAAYKSTVNYRVGGEFRYKILRVRAGYAMQASTYATSFGLNNNIKSISGGVGIRLKKFYSDFALISSTGNNFYQPYSFFDGKGNPQVDLNNKTVTGMLTFGFNF